MRALTVRQPWAWAIVHGGKDVENRSRNVAGRYRGPVAIHAGLAPDTAAQGRWPLADLIPSLAWKVRGAFIGVVDVIDVHQPNPWCSPWGDPDAGVHLVLANPRPLRTPIPARGRLGLWTPDPDLSARILEELA